MQGIWRWGAVGEEKVELQDGAGHGRAPTDLEAVQHFAALDFERFPNEAVRVGVRPYPFG